MNSMSLMRSQTEYSTETPPPVMSSWNPGLS